MATTAIFAELLIIGLEACVWLVLFSRIILGTSEVDISVLKGWEALATIFVLGVAYTLGIVVDRLTDSLLHSIDVKLRNRWIPRREGDPSVSERRLRIMAENERMAEFLDYLRSRVRIARSTVFNLALILVALIVLGIQKATTFADPGAGRVLVMAGTVVPLLLAFALFSWVRISKTYYHRLDQAYRITTREDEALPGGGDPRRR